MFVGSLSDVDNYSGIKLARDDSVIAFGSESDVSIYRSGAGELSVSGSLKINNIDLAAQVANLQAQLNEVIANVTVLQSHDYVYQWFEDGWFTLPAHHYSDGFEVDTHGLASIECTSSTRGMMFYDVSGYPDGICVCTASTSDSTYAWYVHQKC